MTISSVAPPKIDNSLMSGIAPQEQVAQAPLPQTYQDPPYVQEVNKKSIEEHNVVHAPVVNSLMKAGDPNASGEDRLQASKILSNANLNAPILHALIGRRN